MKELVQSHPVIAWKAGKASEAASPNADTKSQIGKTYPIFQSSSKRDFLNLNTAEMSHTRNNSHVCVR